MALSTATEAVDHIARHQKQSIGLETMAIMHALPLCVLSLLLGCSPSLHSSASLMWSMTTFLGSFSALVLDATHASTHWIYGTALLMVALLTLWCVYDTWDKTKWYSRLLNGSLARRGWAQAKKRFEKPKPLSTDSSSGSSTYSTDKTTATPAGMSTDLKHKTPKKKWWQLWWSQPIFQEALPMHNIPPTTISPTRPVTPQPAESQADAAPATV